MSNIDHSSIFASKFNIGDIGPANPGSLHIKDSIDGKGRVALGSDATLSPVGGDDKFYDFSNTITDFSTGTNWNIFRRLLNVNSLADYSGFIASDYLTIQTDPTNSKNYFSIEGFFSETDHKGSGIVTAIFGGGSISANLSNAAIPQQDGFDVYSLNSASGSIGFNTGLFVFTGASAGSILNANYSIFVEAPLTGGTCANNYGLFIYDQSGLAADANTWSIFAFENKSFLGGALGVGKGNPTGPKSPRGDLEIGSKVPTTLMVMSNDTCSQPFTTYADADVFLTMEQNSGASGGVHIRSFIGEDSNPFTLDAYLGSSTPASAAISLWGSKTDGATGNVDLANTEKVIDIGNNGNPALTIYGGLSSKFYGRILSAQGANVSSSNDLALGFDGNFFIVTGNVQINAITTTGWTPGSFIILEFSGTPTIKHNTAGGAGTAKIFLAGSSDFVAASNSILTLMFDGTQWQEISRKAP